MKLVMVIFDIFFALFWCIIGILVLAGVWQVTPIIGFCSMTLASLYNVNEAVNDWDKWRARRN